MTTTLDLAKRVLSELSEYVVSPNNINADKVCTLASQIVTGYIHIRNTALAAANTEYWRVLSTNLRTSLEYVLQHAKSLPESDTVYIQTAQGIHPLSKAQYEIFKRSSHPLAQLPLVPEPSTNTIPNIPVIKLLMAQLIYILDNHARVEVTSELQLALDTIDCGLLANLTLIKQLTI